MFVQAQIVNTTSEQYYWRQVHRQQLDQEKTSEKRHQELRERVVAGLAESEEQAVVLQKEIITTRDGASVILAPKPSVLSGRGDYVVLGFVFILLATLVVATLIRYRREAEIRLLAGNYLADGREAACMTMPALFEAPAPLTSMETNPHQPSDANSLRDFPGAEFLAKAPERIATLRKSLSDFGKAFDDTERQQILGGLRELVVELKRESGIWELRPAWQMSSALELLLERLISKGKELTPSTLRTVASAIDVLGEVCVPGVRPDLVITPPISVLAVDDDPLCLRAVVFALEKAALSPDVATDGEQAVELASGKSYDVIFMDIQMPGIDGLTATSQIRGMEKNEDTPVIFVTVRSDFQTRAESSRLGGTDLIAKPFLQFEITVKALTFAMRKRLQLAASLQRASGSVPAFASPHGHLTTSETTKCQAVAA
jgi:CheY-like chemotaxis protein